MADDDVVLNFLAQVDAARAELERFVRDSDATLERLAREGRTEIVIDISLAKANLDKLAGQLREFVAQADRVKVTNLKLDASQPLSQVAALEARVRSAVESLDALAAASGPSLAPLEVAFRSAAAAVDDFAARSTADSEAFGRGIQSAALEARVALEQLEAALLAAREEVSGVTQEDIDRLLALREGYAQAIAGAADFAETQAAVRRELSGEASALETAELRLAAYLALLEAAGGALTPLQAATRSLEGALLELGARLNSTSATFGQGLPSAAQKAVAALAEVRAEMVSAAESPGGVSEAQLAKVRELEALYQSLILKLRELQATQRQAGDAAVAAGPAVSGLGDKFRELAGYVNLYLATKIASELKKMGDAALAAELDMERINAMLRQAAGNSKDAADELAFLRSSAETLGVPLRQSAEDFAKLEISARETNLTGAETRQLFVGLGAAAAGLRLPVSESTELVGRFADALSRGALDTRTLRQLADAMPGVMEQLARAFLGATGRVEDFRKAVTAGNIPIEDFVRQLAPLLIAQYRDQLPEAVRSTQAEMNRLHNAEFELSASLASEFTPALRQAIDRLKEWAAENGNISTGFGLIGKGLLKTVETLADSAVGIVRLVEVAFYGMEASITGVANRIAGVVSRLTGTDLTDLRESLHILTESFSEESKIAADRFTKLVSDIGATWSGATSENEKLRDSLTGLLDTAGGAPPKFDLLVAAIERSVKAVREYDAEIRNGLEPPTREAADKIVGEIDKAVKAIGQLPTAERVAQQGVLRELSTLREHYESFTTAYLKLQDQQAKAAETAARRELAVLRQRDDAWQKLLGIVQAVSNAEDREAAKKLAAAEGDLASKKARLSALGDQVTLTPDELNEQEELRRSIGETEAAVKKLQQAEIAQGHSGVEAATANEQAAERLEAQFRKAIATDDVLRDSIARLGPAGRDALGGLLQELVELQRRGGATKQEVDDITARIVRLAEEGGQASAHLAERLGLVRNSSDSLRGAFAGLTPEASKGAAALHEVGTAGGAAGAGLDKTTVSAGHSREALAEQAAQAHAAASAERTVGTVHVEAAAAIDKGASAAKGAATASHFAATEARGLGAAVEGAARAAKPAFEDIGRGFRELSTDANKALSSVDFKKIGEGFRELSTDAQVAVPAVERAARALDAATRAGGAFDVESGKLRSSFADVQRASDASAAGFISWSGGIKALPTQEAADQQRQLAASFDTNAAAAARAGGAAEAAAQKLDAAAGASAATGNSIALTSDKLNLFGGSADGASGHLTTVQEKSDAATAASDKLGTSAGSVAPKVGGMGEAAGQAGSRIELLAGHTRSMGVAATEAKKPVGELGDAVRGTARAVQESDLPGNLDQIDRAGRRLAPVASLIAQSFDRIARAHLGEELQKIGDEGDGAAEGLDAVETSLKALAEDDLKKAATGVDAVAKSFHSLAGEMKAAEDSADKVAGSLERIEILCGKVADRVAALATAAAAHV